MKNLPVFCHICHVANITVIPAKAGIQKLRISKKYWIPAFAGMTLVVSCFLSNQTLDTCHMAISEAGHKYSIFNIQ